MTHVVDRDWRETSVRMDAIPGSVPSFTPGSARLPPPCPGPHATPEVPKVEGRAPHALAYAGAFDCLAVDVDAGFGESAALVLRASEFPPPNARRIDFGGGRGGADGNLTVVRPEDGGPFGISVQGGIHLTGVAGTATLPNGSTIPLGFSTWVHGKSRFLGDLGLGFPGQSLVEPTGNGTLRVRPLEYGGDVEVSSGSPITVVAPWAVVFVDFGSEPFEGPVNLSLEPQTIRLPSWEVGPFESVETAGAIEVRTTKAGTLAVRGRDAPFTLAGKTGSATGTLLVDFRGLRLDVAGARVALTANATLLRDPATGGSRPLANATLSLDEPAHAIEADAGDVAAFWLGVRETGGAWDAADVAVELRRTPAAFLAPFVSPRANPPPDGAGAREAASGMDFAVAGEGDACRRAAGAVPAGTACHYPVAVRAPLTPGRYAFGVSVRSSNAASVAVELELVVRADWPKPGAAESATAFAFEGTTGDLAADPCYGDDAPAVGVANGTARAGTGALRIPPAADGSYCYPTVRVPVPVAGNDSVIVARAFLHDDLSGGRRSIALGPMSVVYGKDRLGFGDPDGEAAYRWSGERSSECRFATDGCLDLGARSAGWHEARFEITARGTRLFWDGAIVGTDARTKLGDVAHLAFTNSGESRDLLVDDVAIEVHRAA